MTGSLPELLGNCRSLYYIFVSSNSLIGKIPNTFNQLTSLQYAFISLNYLSGTIPSNINILSKLVTLDLRSNYLTMGLANFVPNSTFPKNLLINGKLDISENCLVYIYGGVTVGKSHCPPPTGEYYT